MKFHEYEDSYKFDREKRCLDQLGLTNVGLYAQQLDYFSTICDPEFKETETARAGIAAFEAAWIENKRPYYDIYPSIIPALEKLEMDFPLDTIKMPYGLSELLVRYPVGYCNIRSIFMGYHFDPQNTEHCLMLSVQANKESDPDDLDRGLVSFAWQPGTNGADVVREIYGNEKKIYIIDQMAKAFKTAIAICLIGEDPSLVERCILSKDMSKVNEANMDRLVDKAKRRGKFGFTLGRELEMIPHLRRPHMWWKPYGPGRKFRKFCLRKGSVIHKDVVNQVPSGNLDD